MSETIKISWSDGLIWKKSITATSMCLAGCSIGTMGIASYLIEFNIFLALAISLVVGFLTCMLFMIAWNTLFRKMNIKEAFVLSYKMSIVSILIMMVTENLILLVIAPKFLSHEMGMHSSHTFKIMLVAMAFGFLFSLPYNYYQLHKTGKICH